MQTPSRKVAVNVPLDSLKATPDQFGAQQGRALVDMGSAVQGVSSVAEGILKQHDTFKAQKTYNDFVERALQGDKDNLQQTTAAGYNDYAKRQGQQAFGSATEYSAYLDKIKKEALDGLSPRQQRLFLQNADPKSISLKQQMAGHEIQQVEAAQRSEQKRTMERGVEEFGRTGKLEDRGAAIAGFENVTKDMTPKEREIARAQFDELLDKTRRDNLIKAQDFAGAYAAAGLTPGADPTDENLSVRQKEDALFIQDAERSYKDKQLSIEKKQIQDAQDQAAIWEHTHNELAPMDEYVKWNGGNTEMAERARNSDLIKRAQRAEKLKDEQQVLWANDPDNRAANYLEIERNLMHFELGQITSTELNDSMEKLVGDTGAYAAQLKPRVAETIRNRMLGKTDEQQNWLTDTRIQMATIFNKANKEAVFGIGGAVKGTVTLKTDKSGVKSHNDASSGFARLMSDFETALQKQRDMLKRPLTYDEYNKLEDDYLGEIKKFNREEQFRGDSTVYLSSLPIGPDSPYWNPDKAKGAASQKEVSGYDVLMAEFNSMNSIATNEVGPYVQSPSNR